MKVLRGTWIPGEAGTFVREGRFCLWVETDAALSSRRTKADSGLHPHHLTPPRLDAFLEERLTLRSPSYAPRQSHRPPTSLYAVLPSTGDAPLPSLEMLRFSGEDAPSSFELRAWQVACYPIALTRLLGVLKDCHFLAQQEDDEVTIGGDLLFWYHYLLTLRDLIVRDSYIPALVAREQKVTGRARPGAVPFYELHPSWEIISARYEDDVAGFAAAMPWACACGYPSKPPHPVLFDRESLVRHFSEVFLHETVVGTPLTAKLDTQLAGSFVYGCMHPSSFKQSSFAVAGGAALDEYRAWRTWRDDLARGHTTSRFTLCFQLVEAPAEREDDWQVRFLVASRRDPSLKLPLEDYWRLGGAARKAALREFGAGFARDLLLALGHAARIYPRVWDGLNTDQPTGFELPLDEAFAFLKDAAWVLEDAGYTVIVPAWWTPQGRRRAKIRLRTAQKGGPAATSSGYFGLDSLVTYRYELSIDGQPVTEAEWKALVAAKTPLVQFRGQWMELDRAHMQQMLQFWRDHAGEGQAEMSLSKMMRLTADEGGDIEWDHDDALATMLARLHDTSHLEPVDDPAGLRGSLRGYQKRGLAWLRYLEELGLNPCLADDMGLGKSIQVIARLIDERNRGGAVAPTLLVAPTSVLGNWQREIERFAPHLRAVVHHGAERIKDEQVFRAASARHDVVITSFPLARMDEKLLRAVAWHRVVVDEAQNIKNPRAAQTRAITRVSAQHRVALTGTPVENRLMDLWSIFNFLNPGFLGKETQFRKTFELPIQKDGDQTASVTLKRLVEPFILRRVKTDRQIIQDLPDKVEQKVYCNLSREQASLYEAVVKQAAEEVENAEGMGRRGLILATLTRLKQICNHPAQFLQDGSAFTPERSHKLSRLLEMADEARQSGDSMLVFTQFAEVGAALEKLLRQTHHYTTYYLHGGTDRARRERMVAAFQDPLTGPAVFVLSLRAGGTGLNLTKANHVFHFDRWWNPAVEDQATDRAFRIGQQKNVLVHKFVALGTLEERIDAMLEDKRKLAGVVVGSDESWLTELNNDAFKALIALNRSTILE